MKKTLSVLLLLLMVLLCVSGCKKDSLKIDEHRWNFSLVMSNKTGQVVYCAKDRHPLHPQAALLDLRCTAKGGTITLKTGNKSWELPYTLDEEGPNGAVYRIGTNGTALASVSKTTFNDGSWEHTLTLAIDQYTLYFRD